MKENLCKNCGEILKISKRADFCSEHCRSVYKKNYKAEWARKYRKANKITNSKVSTKKCRQLNPNSSSHQEEKSLKKDFRQHTSQKIRRSEVNFSKNGNVRINIKDLILDCSKLSESVFAIGISKNDKAINLGFISNKESALMVFYKLENLLKEISYNDK